MDEIDIVVESFKKYLNGLTKMARQCVIADILVECAPEFKWKLNNNGATPDPNADVPVDRIEKLEKLVDALSQLKNETKVEEVIDSSSDPDLYRTEFEDAVEQAHEIYNFIALNNYEEAEDEGALIAGAFLKFALNDCYTTRSPFDF